MLNLMTNYFHLELATIVKTRRKNGLQTVSWGLQRTKGVLVRQPHRHTLQGFYFPFYFFILGSLRQGLAQPRPASHSSFPLPSPLHHWDYRCTVMPASNSGTGKPHFKLDYQWLKLLDLADPERPYLEKSRAQPVHSKILFCSQGELLFA